MQKTTVKSIVHKEITLSVVSRTYLEAEKTDPHRSMYMRGVSRKCNYEMLRRQETGWPDDED